MHDVSADAGIRVSDVSLLASDTSLYCAVADVDNSECWPQNAT